MASYSILASDASQSTPVLQKGPVTILPTVNVYFKVGENPVANSTNCGIVRAGSRLTLNIPVKCSKIAIIAVADSGLVTIMEESGGALSSCSA